MIPLTHDLILQFASEEAEAAGAKVGDVLGMAIDIRSKAARRRAMDRIIAETGCSYSALARLWGCDRNIPGRYTRPPATPPVYRRAEKPLYDANTRHHLRLAHGETRAAEIIAGADAQTNIDIAAWRSLGGTS